MSDWDWLLSYQITVIPEYKNLQFNSNLVNSLFEGKLSNENHILYQVQIWSMPNKYVKMTDVKDVTGGTVSVCHCKATPGKSQIRLYTSLKNQRWKGVKEKEWRTELWGRGAGLFMADVTKKDPYSFLSSKLLSCPFFYSIWQIIYADINEELQRTWYHALNLCRVFVFGVIS